MIPIKVYIVRINPLIGIFNSITLNKNLEVFILTFKMFYFCAFLSEDNEMYLCIVNWFVANKLNMLPQPPITNANAECRIRGSIRKLNCTSKLLFY